MSDPTEGSDENALPVPGMPVIFYDGDCGFCNQSVRFVLEHEQRPNTLFAPIQGETAAKVLKDSSLPADIGKRTMILFENGDFLLRGRAVLRTMELMGGTWVTLARVFKLIPVPLTNGVYRIVAKMRRELPGQTCAILQPEQRKRFLP